MNGSRWLAFLIGLALAVAGHSQPAFQDEDLAFKSAEAKRVTALLEKGDYQAGLKEATALSGRDPHNLELAMLIGMIQAELGNYDEALAAFHRGIREAKDNLPFLLIAARLHAMRGELGPGAVQANGMTRFSPDNLSPEQRTAFRRTEFVAAADCLKQAAALRPTRAKYQIARVELLVKGQADDAAIAAAEEYLQTAANEPALWLAKAQSAVALRRWSDAERAAKRTLELRPHDAEAYSALESAATNARDPKLAVEYHRRAAFYRYIRPDYAIPYSDERFALIEKVAVPQTELSEADRKRRHERAVATIESLKKDRSDEASRLLAAICWQHAFHGEIEDGMYAELEARKDEPLLRAMLIDAHSYCTVGSCALALARLRSDEGFKLIASRLLADRNSFPMNIPEALAIYGRPESVPALAFALQDEIAMLEREPENIMVAMGTGMAARRCVWALARFESPAATAALENAATHRGFETDAIAALFFQSPTPERRTRMLAQLKANADDAEWIASRLKSAGLPEAAEVQAIADDLKKKHPKGK